MGASYSIMGGQDQLIPVELVIKILLYLSVGDLASCRRVSHTLNDIMTSSHQIQHRSICTLAGVVDNPYATLSLPELRSALARHQTAWDSFKPQHITTAKSTRDYLPTIIQDGIYFRLWHPDFHDRIGYHLLPQPQQSFADLWSHLSPLPRQHDSYCTCHLPQGE